MRSAEYGFLAAVRVARLLSILVVANRELCYSQNVNLVILCND